MTNKTHTLFLKTLPFFYGILILLIVCSGSLFQGCHRGYGDDVKLEFSTDTLMFDTVFTTITSVTRNFTVKNPGKQPVKLRICLAGAQQSYYSINVNGQSGVEFDEVEIPGRDSIFVFVKVNINPTDHNTPYLVTDSVLFYNTNRRQAVQLVAFGQDAHFIVADHGGSMPYKIVAHEHEEVHWTNDKPWVIYGWAAVDSLGKLIIDPGTRVYIHGGGIWVYRYGNIHINGTVDQPVIIRGDHLESFFDADYAQWDRILINEGTQDNLIENAIISHAAIGLEMDILQEFLGNKTIVNNTIIKDNKLYGVLCHAANLEMNNCQVSNNGTYSIAMHVGDYKLNHVTVANFTTAARKTPAVLLSNYYDATQINAAGEYETVYMMGDANLECNNSIIYGNRSDDGDEFAISRANGAEVDFTFHNCILKKENLGSMFISCFNLPPKFVSDYSQNYNLQEDSPAINNGMSGLGITTDLLGRTRNGIPDIGAYEYYPEPDTRGFRWLGRR